MRYWTLMLATAVAGAFLAIDRFAFAPPAAKWIAFGVAIGATVLTLVASAAALIGVNHAFSGFSAVAVVAAAWTSRCLWSPHPLRYGWRSPAGSRCSRSLLARSHDTKPRSNASSTRSTHASWRPERCSNPRRKRVLQVPARASDGGLCRGAGLTSVQMHRRTASSTRVSVLPAPRSVRARLQPQPPTRVCDRASRRYGHRSAFGAHRSSAVRSGASDCHIDVMEASHASHTHVLPRSRSRHH